MFGAVDLGVADHGQRAGAEERAQVAVALLCDAAQPLFAPARVLLWDQTDPGREVPRTALFRLAAQTAFRQDRVPKEVNLFSVDYGLLSSSQQYFSHCHFWLIRSCLALYGIIMRY